MKSCVSTEVRAVSLQEVSLFEVIEFIKFNGGYYCSCLKNFPSKNLTGLASAAPQFSYLPFYLYICICPILKFTVERSVDNILYVQGYFINSVHRMSLLLHGPASAPATCYPARHCLAFQYTHGPEAQLAHSNLIVPLMCTSY